MDTQNWDEDETQEFQSIVSKLRLHTANFHQPSELSSLYSMTKQSGDDDEQPKKPW